MDQKLLTNLSMTIDKSSLLELLKSKEDPFIIKEPEENDEPKMQILEKPKQKTNNANSIELF